MLVTVDCKGGKMKPYRMPIIAGCLALSALMAVGLAYAKRPVHPRPYPLFGIYLEMNEDFYRALEEEAPMGSSTLTTNKSDILLNQIAITGRYAVETNIQILQQQERIIQLLETIRDNTAKAP